MDYLKLKIPTTEMRMINCNSSITCSIFICNFQGLIYISEQVPNLPKVTSVDNEERGVRVYIRRLFLFAKVSLLKYIINVSPLMSVVIKKNHYNTVYLRFLHLQSDHFDSKIRLRFYGCKGLYTRKF